MMNTLGVGLIVVIALVLLAKVSLAASGVSKTDAKEKIQQGATVVDVRTSEEYAAGHYQGAKNIPLQELKKRLAELGDKKTALVVYCASGMRSAKAAKILTAAGFTDVVNAGGLHNLDK